MDRLIAALFDFSFSRFATPSLVKVVYGLIVLLAVVQALGAVLMGFRGGVASGVVSLVLAPLIFLTVVGLARLALEAVLNVMRVANYTRELARATRPGRESEGAPEAPTEDEESHTVPGTAPKKSGF